MKKRILVITLAMALVMTSACNSKKSDKSDDAKKKETSESAADDADETAEQASKDAEGTSEGTPEETTTEAATEASTEESTAADTEETTEATTSETTEATTSETEERDETAYVFDLSEMTAEEIADLCDSLTTRKIPQIGDTVGDVQKTYFDVEPYTFKSGFEGRYSKSDKDNINVIFLSGVFVDEDPEILETRVDRIDRFGTGLVMDIYDRAKAEEFIQIMKERHPVLEQKPDGSWRAEDFVVGITPTDFFTWDNGVHFQIAYGENSDWYESVSGFFGFGFDIDLDETSETTTA
ncbi:MAG: hypothetical protein J5636_10260 [Clostridiales bacterium]|nr:hypothetical protein [Clostridiales bacterium]